MSNDRPPLLKPQEPPGPPSGRGASPTPSPNDHVKTLIELLKPGAADLARRWLAALLLVPAAEREEVVKAVEAQIVAEYDLGEDAAEREMVVRYPAVQRAGYVEEIVKRYEVKEHAPNEARRADGERRRAVGGGGGA